MYNIALSKLYKHMQNELTPKQQASELIKQAHNIIIVTGREPSNDQLSAAIAVQRALNKLQKQASVVITDALPKSADLYDTQFISNDVQGVRDFIISLDMHSVVVDKLKYNVEGEKLDITITPLNGNFNAKDVSFEQGPYKFDLVIALGVPHITKLDKIVELADKYDALIMIDECHASGFMGKTGRGTHEHHNVMGRIDIITGTLGKALGGASGGYTSGRREVIAWLRQRSRPYLFSNSLAPMIALFVAAQQYFVRGIALSGLKG